MSRFTGSQGKGAMRRLRETKRAEAEVRQAAVLHERTKSHRIDCATDGSDCAGAAS